MSGETVISLRQISMYFHIDFEVARDFADFGLYPTLRRGDEVLVEIVHLARVRKIVELYRALGVNKEGIEVILNLGDKISGLETEIEALRIERAQFQRGDEGKSLEFLRERGLLIEIEP